MLSSSRLTVVLTLSWLCALTCALLLTPWMLALSKEMSSLPWWASAGIILWTVPIAPALWAVALTGPLFVAIPVRELLIEKGVITVGYRAAQSHLASGAVVPSPLPSAKTSDIPGDDTVVLPRSRRTVGA